jgi:hypothetical protein
MTGREKKVGGWRKIWCGMVRGALRGRAGRAVTAGCGRDLDLASEEPAWVTGSFQSMGSFPGHLITGGPGNYEPYSMYRLALREVIQCTFP